MQVVAARFKVLAGGLLDRASSYFYFPCSKSMNGGKVSRNPTARRANAVTLILTMDTVCMCHMRFKANQATSQTMIATVVTPERVPVGL